MGKVGVRLIALNLVRVLREPKCLATAAVTSALFAALYLLLLGLYRIPIIEFGVNRMSPVLLEDYLFALVASLMTGVLVAAYRYKASALDAGGGAAGSGGLFAGILSATCPVCQGLTFAVAGAPVAFANLGFLVPYITEIRIASIALLSFGAYAMLKDLHICTFCKVPSATSATKTKTGLFDSIAQPPYSHALYVLVTVALVTAVLQTTVVLGSLSSSRTVTLPSDSLMAGDGKINLHALTNEVTPKGGFTIDARWGTVVKDMVEAGVLDPVKLEDIITKRYGQKMKPEEKALLASPSSDVKLHIDNDNAVFMMYLLWVLGKHNDNPVPKESPFADAFDNYDIGVGKAGYADTPLITLTPEQQEVVRNVALNTYRPCCNNPTGYPDCSHGFALLGLIELMASQGYSEEEIYDAALKFNSLWFPSHYIQAAAYFQLKENKSWDQVDPRVVMGKEFSTLQGSYKIRRELAALGV